MDLSETEMRQATVPEIGSTDELVAYVNGLTERSHDYGTCVYAMSMAAVAAFNYVAGRLGVTGFQASCADLDILRRTRRLDGPFMLVKGEDMLYPQYDIPARVREALGEWSEWAAEEARKNLEKHPDAPPSVLKHWRKLAAYKP